MAGRPIKTEQQRLFEGRCREFMNTKGWRKLMAMAENGDNSDAKFALEKMMQYGWGKPRETLDVTTRDETVRSSEAITAELESIIGLPKDKGAEPGIGTEGNA